jgi:hypothetical protein
MLLLIAVACYLLPFGVDAQTGSSRPNLYLRKNIKKLPVWKVNFLKNFIILNILNSTILFIGIYFSVYGLGSGPIDVRAAI